MSTDHVIPQVRERAPFHLWLFNRGMTLSEGAQAAGVAQGQLSRALRDPSDENFQRASLEMRTKVKVLTQGEISLDDWPEKSDTTARTPFAVAPAARGAPSASRAGSLRREG